MNADDAVDASATDEYGQAVSDLLAKEKFQLLDCLAEAALFKKEKFSGGMWKVHLLYDGLSRPRLHATEEDWKVQLERLEHWMQAEPGSVTAQVALAEAYTNYGWYARGENEADTVSESGWRLFGERLAQARQILEKVGPDAASNPEWYLAMQSVALGQGWRPPDEQGLFNRAVAAMPDYYYFYRMHAMFLLPRWYGEDNDSERFAQAAADRLGGEQGDGLYFRIAGHLLCRCPQERELQSMSWSRIQRGFTAVEKHDGPSLTNLNLLALMAVKKHDAEVADKAFTRIGEQWDKSTWHNREFFESSKKWASQIAPFMAWQHDGK